MFWFFAIALCLLAAVFIIYPLWRGAKASNSEDVGLREKANIELFHERQEDLEADLAGGEIDQAQHDLLLLELKQKLLLDVSSDSGGNKNKIKQASSSSAEKGLKLTSLTVVLPLLFVLATPGAAYVLYEKWGFFDDVQLTDLYQRTVNNSGDVEEAKALIIALGEAVQEDEQPWTLYFLGENFANVSMFNEAAIVYQRSANLLDESPEKALVLGRVALAKYILAGFEVTAEVLEVINQARDINPSEISILQLLAADAEQREDYEAAIEYWRLLIQSNPNSEQAQSLRNNIAAAQLILARDNPELNAGASINVSISLADGVEVPDNLRVFVAARNAEREGMPPLAAVDLLAGELPTIVRLDNFSAVGPFNLSSASTVYVSALVSFAGIASPQAGDYRVVSQNFSPNGQNVDIELIISNQIQ